MTNQNCICPSHWSPQFYCIHRNKGMLRFHLMYWMNMMTIYHLPSTWAELLMWIYILIQLWMQYHFVIYMFDKFNYVATDIIKYLDQKKKNDMDGNKSLVNCSVFIIFLWWARAQSMNSFDDFPTLQTPEFLADDQLFNFDIYSQHWTIITSYLYVFRSTFTLKIPQFIHSRLPGDNYCKLLWGYWWFLSAAWTHHTPNQNLDLQYLYMQIKIWPSFVILYLKSFVWWLFYWDAYELTAWLLLIAFATLLLISEWFLYSKCNV